MHVSASLVAVSRLRFVFFAAFLCVACSNGFAQAASSDYTTDLPSVDRVKAEIKGSDPTDTLARQVAVFTYLQAYIDRIKYNRSYSGPYTPGEQNARAAYSLAAYQISQDYAKTHPAEAAAFERLHGQYEMNSDFYKDWSKRLIGKQSAAAYKGAEAGLAATQQAHIDSIKRANEEARAQSQAHTTNAQGLSNDPTAVATRRCLELGGDATACMGKSFVGGLMSMVGLDSAAMQAITGPGRAGVVLSGLYQTTGSATSISFGDESAAIQNCGKLVADGHGYTLQKNPNSLEILIQNEPRPIQLSMRSDGSLGGPGPVDVKGRIIIGYHTVTSTLMVNGYRATPDQCNGPCQTSTQVPDYAPKIERCTIASLAPPPPSKPASAAETQGAGMIGMLTGMMGTIAPLSEPGLRMAGKYSSSSGLLLDFGGDAVTLDCGQAHVKAPYTVENRPSQFLINIQNGGGPFTLAVASDSTLHGSGSTAVNGRLVSGMNGDNVTFTPHGETCTVGTFAANSAAPSTSIAAGSPAPAAAATSLVTSAAASPATSTGMTLAISSSFPIANNPLSGRIVQLMSERYDIALRKVGAPVSADITPGRALMAYMANCGPPKSCPAYSAALHPYFVGKATFDGNGKATVTADIPPGSYYVFTAANGTSSALVWDLPVTLEAGDNTITLTATNAELVH
jgi:hypothetical protein